MVNHKLLAAANNCYLATRDLSIRNIEIIDFKSGRDKIAVIILKTDPREILSINENPELKDGFSSIIYLGSRLVWKT